LYFSLHHHVISLQACHHNDTAIRFSTSISPKFSCEAFLTGDSTPMNFVPFYTENNPTSTYVICILLDLV
jgi:hypothetical protein